MAAAKYTIHVPAADELGNPLKAHRAVHQHLLNVGHETPSIQEGYPIHQVSTWAEESPEMDSSIKQIGTYAGEVTNAPHIYVTKEGQNTARWPMRNPHYMEGMPAEQSAFANEPNIGDIGLEHPETEMGGIPAGTPMPQGIPMNPLPTAQPLP